MAISTDTGCFKFTNTTSNTHRTAAALIEAGADADLIAIEGADHADLHFFQREVWKIIADFFEEKLSVK